MRQHLMRAARADVTHLEQEIMSKGRLEIEVELLRQRRTIPLINNRDGPLSGRRVNGKLGEGQVRPERIGEAGRRIWRADQLPGQRERRAGRQLEKRLPSSAG